jgi:hypothetical protein
MTGEMDADEAVARMAKTIDEKAKLEFSGGFFHRDGQLLPN